MSADLDRWNCMECGWSGPRALWDPEGAYRMCPVCFNDELWDLDALVRRDRLKLAAWTRACEGARA